MEAEDLEVGEVRDGGGDGEVEVGVGDVELGDAVGFAVVAFDHVPVAAVGVSVPRGEGVGVVEVFFYFEVGFFVIWVAPL